MKYRFALYTAGATAAASRRALLNLSRIMDDVLPEGYEIEVVDILSAPERADAAGVFATPTLIREWPPPEMLVIGDMADAAAVLKGVGL